MAIDTRKTSIKQENSTPKFVTGQPRTARLTGLSISPLLGGLIVGVVAVFLLILVTGSVNIPLEDVVRVLTGGEASKDSWTNIVLKFRLPKALAAVVAGAALSVSGLMMQTFFRNPLAGPFVLGISSGASLGVALVVLTAGTVGGAVLAGFGFFGDLGLALAAMLGAGLAMMIVLSVARQVRSSTTLLILGVMFGYLTSALVSLLMYFSIPERIQAYINWTFGTFNTVTWGQLQILLPAVLLGLLAAFTLGKSLNALLLGEDYARSMGLDVRRARLWIIGITAVLAGTVTAFCGPIGFVGMAVPHLCRALFNTSDHRTLLPAVMLMGAMIAMAASIIAELPGSSLTLPLNAITSLLGAPVVMWVILRQNNTQALKT